MLLLSYKILKQYTFRSLSRLIAKQNVSKSGEIKIRRECMLMRRMLGDKWFLLFKKMFNPIFLFRMQIVSPLKALFAVERFLAILISEVAQMQIAPSHLTFVKMKRVIHFSSQFTSNASYHNSYIQLPNLKWVTSKDS